MCITVFVHGIISVKPYMSLANFIRFKQDHISHTPYAHAVELTRKNPFYYQHHAMQGLGLQEITMNVIAPGLGATAFARAYDTIAQKSGYACTKNLYYTFGWSGLLSHKMRVIEAEIFYRSLLDVLKPYYEKEIFPKIRIIGYSHGARIALELASAQYAVQSPFKFTVDELILIGMPVVPASIFCVKNPIFNKVYHIYSEKDRVQRIDFASVNGLFSNSKFRSNSCVTLPKKLTQISFRVFRLTYDYEKKIKNKILPCPVNPKKLRPAHPGHTELWSFGWTPKNYRTTLPYNPLPAAAFIPYLIQAAHTIPDYNHIIVELHTYNASLLVGPKGEKSCVKLPFLHDQEFLALKHDALMFKPENFTYEAFQKHCQEAHNISKKLYRQETPYF